MDKGISPEEKLLKLIRGKGRKDSGEKSTTAVSVNKKAYIRPNYLKPINKFLKAKLVPILDFKLLNILLISLLIILLANFLFNALNPIKGRIQRIAESSKSKEKEQEEFKISQPKDYDYYYQQFSKRDIFNAPSLDIKPDESGMSLNIKEAIKNYKLVGVILDQEPQAIIEDVSTKTTYFLNKGDSLDKLSVKDILESKVILIYAGEEFELEL